MSHESVLSFQFQVIDVGTEQEPMFRNRSSWVRLSERFKLVRTRSFCSDNNNNGKTSTGKSTGNSHKAESNVSNLDERYRRLENLDFITAAKILFTDPPNKKKFGIDFHLVQFFFACLPSLAIYLVAQYARYEIRKMEVEVEQKRKLKEEEEAKEKEKEIELNPPEGKEAKSDPQLLKVKERLDKLEEAVKVIVVETKKQSSSSLVKNQLNGDDKKKIESSAPSDRNSGSSSNRPLEKEHVGKHDSLKLKPELGQEKSIKGSETAPNARTKVQGLLKVLGWEERIFKSL